MGQQTQEEPRLGLGNMRAPMTSARPLAGQVPPVRTVRQPIAQPEPVRNVRTPIAAAEPEFVPQEEAAMDDVGETMLEETTAPTQEEIVEETVLTEVEEETTVAEDAEKEETMVEEIDSSTSTMQRPTALLKPIRGTLRPLEEEEEVRTASLTPVGHMLMPEKKRGPPPSSSVGQQTATLRPVRGTLTPVSKTPVKRLEPNDETDED